ncbi:MAG: globin domain-containing protein [Pseudohongiellaceae bacterium]|nr:globin domain-containing protein [Pseudohongiellaceae bacterium]
MDEKQIKQVQVSFSRLLPYSAKAAALFYSRLFALSPRLESLFTSSMETQGESFMKMISMVVRGLDDIDALHLLLGSVGVRHVAYGVTDEDYDVCTESFVWAIEQAQSEDFSPELRAAWFTVFGLFSKAMKDAARASERPQSSLSNLSARAAG